MEFTLVHTFPNGTERRVSVPLPSIAKAAAAAARSLLDNRRATKDEAAAFADYLAKMPVGQPLLHWPSRYAARIECAGTIAPQAPGSLRITKIQKCRYLGTEAERWEVRTGGTFSLRTVYRRWVADGQHWVTSDPVMVDNGSFHIGGGPQPHKAGDLYAWTIRGDGRKRPFYILTPERQLPQDAPTNQLLLPAT